MEPRALATSNSMPKEKEISIPVKDSAELDTAQRALTELSINKGIPFKFKLIRF